MALEKTLAIIKPDAFPRREEIIEDLRKSGFNILERVDEHVTVPEWKKFYQEHDGRDYFDRLIGHMSSGPVSILVLEKNNGIKDYRQLMGATDPKKARKDSLRAKYGSEMPKNAVHGSDSIEAASKEISIFFGGKYK